MKQRGFTLIEMVLTIIVGGILVLGIAGFVELGTQGYATTVDRQRLQTQAKFVMEKLTREVRHAVPNVFVDYGTNQRCISFYPIVESGFYSVSGADIQFIVGNLSASVSSLDGLTLLINPTEQLNDNQNLSVLNNSFALTPTSVDTLTISGAVGSTFVLPNQANNLVGGSVVNRHYITDGNRQITYCVSTDNRVVRGEGNTAVSADMAPLTDAAWVSVSGAISYQPANVQYNGVVHADLQFSQNDELTHFQQDVQVLNVP
ncbi:PilW family protein [Vibrio sp. LaRot3]|uniref:PilW family protein n=1 Tax=Vibrio sp. LaRot3 TaxID=2998829 RepID=UPI0022CE32D4|nr:prepilin-type N-terminal cleavage/methylation domain-containing protein [Vibrio sp. LaRot3]MDA0148574.1 prepilin-type N-terminal cleavage/methylation domain-containing protein [Vibrio sp. LaRot3]